VKIFTLKFDLLLAQYLYKNKKLNLPGIGRFEADNSIYLPDENDKQKPSLAGITFQPATITRADDDLIEFIKEHTGKMKPLAISDLESYVTLGKQFLYIGKPFYIEGIGTLQLTKKGNFEFAAGEYITTKLEDPNVERSEGKKKSVIEEDRITKESNNNTFKKVLLFVVIIAAVAALGWGGYYFYSRYAGKESGAAFTGTGNQPDSANGSLSQDSLSAYAQTLDDSLAAISHASAVTPGSAVYKFIVEITDNRLRALNRYKDLRSYGNMIQVESTDSVNYKLFYAIRTTPEDTLRIRDSLNRWYYRNTEVNRVLIEQ
jgi:hypothetical protein